MKIHHLLLLLIIILSGSIQISCSSTLTAPKPGGRIAYVDANGNIQVLELDSGESYVVIDGTGNSYPSWSPDGKQLAYIRQKSEIWIYDFDTDETNRVHREYSAFVSYLDWANDSSKIYFHSGGPTIANLKFIKCINLDDSTSCRKFSVDSDGGFDISLDGRIAFYEFRNAPTVGYGIFIYDIQNPINRAAVNILPSEALGPAWSPDGSFISLYVDEKLVKILSNGRGRVIIVDEVNPGLWEWHEPTASWSLDGSYIAYEDDSYIWIIDADGKNKAQKLVQGVEPNWGP